MDILLLHKMQPEAQSCCGRRCLSLFLKSALLYMFLFTTFLLMMAINEELFTTFKRKKLKNVQNGNDGFHSITQTLMCSYNKELLRLTRRYAGSMVCLIL